MTLDSNWCLLTWFFQQLTQQWTDMTPSQCAYFSLVFKWHASFFIISFSTPRQEKTNPPFRSLVPQFPWVVSVLFGGRWKWIGGEAEASQTQETKEQTVQKEKKGAKGGECAAPHTEVCLICLQTKRTFNTVTEREMFFSASQITLLWCPRSSQSPEKRVILEEEKEQSGKREKPVVRPEEIPPVPENRFLLRRDVPSQDDKTETSVMSRTEITTFPLVEWIRDWFEFSCFQSWESRSFSFCWPKTSSLQVWPEDSRQRNDGIFKSIPVLPVYSFFLFIH